MKVFLVFLILVVFGLGGFIGYQFITKTPKSSSTEIVSPTTNETVTKTGILKKGTLKSDSPFILIEEKTTEAVSSTTVKLDLFVGKKVTITGQYSGTTLYADKVVSIK